MCVWHYKKSVVDTHVSGACPLQFAVAVVNNEDGGCQERPTVRSPYGGQGDSPSQMRSCRGDG
jgi:hypothetical protein